MEERLNGKESLNSLGLTTSEQKVVDRLMNTYQAYLDLEQQHPNELQELGHAVHMIRGLLSTRIARRCFPSGWPTHEGELLLNIAYEEVD